MQYKEKEIIVFDLDGTLARSKQPMDQEISELLNRLLALKKVAVASAAGYIQFEKQFLVSLHASVELAKNLFLFPTSGTSFYRYSEGQWQKVYEELLTETEQKKIFDAFEKALGEAGFVKSEKLYGVLIEDRKTQVTFSAYGSEAPLELKQTWDPDHSKRLHIISYLKKYLPEYSIESGGATSIDVTRKGIDKGYTIHQIEKFLSIPIPRMLFIGDALFPGGNDYPAKRTGVECVAVKNPEETKAIIRNILE